MSAFVASSMLALATSSSYAAACKYQGKARTLATKYSTKVRILSMNAAEAVTSSADNVTSVTSSSTGLTYTHLESNTMVFQIKNKRVLVDPWLVGTLQFGSPYIFEAQKELLQDMQSANHAKITEKFGRFDAILLSQHLPDHLHAPTLRVMDKNIPVFGPPEAIDMVKSLGFKNCTVIDHGQTVSLFGDESPAVSRVDVKATVGAVVGPPWSKPMNGYVITFHDFNKTLYYEPHADATSSTLRNAVKKVDIAILPAIQAELGIAPLTYPLVNGGDKTLDTLRIIKPSLFIPLINGTWKSRGLLDKLVSMKGDLSTFVQSVERDSSLSCKVVTDQKPGRPVDLLV